jgi:hypothetical protein
MNTSEIKNLCRITKITSSRNNLSEYNNLISKKLGMRLNNNKIERFPTQYKGLDKYNMTVSNTTPTKIVNAFKSNILTNEFRNFFNSLLKTKDKTCMACNLCNGQKYGLIEFDTNEDCWSSKEYMEVYKKKYNYLKNMTVQIDQAHHADRPTLAIIAAQILMEDTKDINLKEFIELFLFLHSNIPIYYLCKSKCHNYYDNKLGKDNHDGVYDNIVIKDNNIIKKVLTTNNAINKEHVLNCIQVLGISNNVEKM